MKAKAKSPLIELLESRIAPAGIITLSGDGRTASWTDVDGDSVTMKITKGVLQQTLFTTDQSSPEGLQVTQLDLTAPGFKGTNVTVNAARNPLTGGDGTVNIGFINAPGQNLGTISVAGDLGRIDAGDPALTTKTLTAIAAINVRSMGMLDGATLPSGVTQTSEIVGKVGSIAIKGSIKGILFNVTGDVAGSIGSLSIGGSLIGTADADSGRISTTGGIGAILIKGSIIGSDGQNSGSIAAGGSIKSLRIDGSVFGGRSDTPSTEGTGVVRTEQTLGAVTVLGSIYGGTQQDSGLISAAGNMTSVKISGGIFGGSAGTTNGGVIGGGNVSSINVKGDIVGGGALESGIIRIEGKAGSVILAGGVSGGAGAGSGALTLGTDTTDSVTSLTIARDVTGGTGEDSGVIQTSGQVRTLALKGSLKGAAGTGSGAVHLDGGASTSNVAGDIIGGTGVNSGSITSGESLGSLTIGGSVFGGTADFAGSLLAESGIKTLTINGSVLGGDLAGSAAGDLVGSGLVQAGSVNKLNIRGSIVAGSDYHLAHSLVNNAAIRIEHSLTALSIKGSVEGNSDTLIFITARGQEVLPLNARDDAAFGTINVGGSVRFANILAGYDTTTDARLAESNPNAQIDRVVVLGEWVESNLAAGVKWNDNFGDGTDVIASGVDSPTITARINSVSVIGQIVGTAGDSSDHYGFVTQALISMTVGGAVPAPPPALLPSLQGAKNAISLNLGKGNDNDPVSLRYNLSNTLDVRVFEVL